MFKKKKTEMDAYSTTSGTSKASARSRASQGSSDRRKTRRFSLRDLFYRAPTRPLRDFRRRPFETRSDGSIHSRLEKERLEREATMAMLKRDMHGAAPDQIVVLPKRVANEQGLYECPLCLDEFTDDQFPIIMTCPHRSCINCLKQYLLIEITESRVDITCPECSFRLHPNDISAILENPALLHKYEEFMLRRVLVTDPDIRWCPAPDCGYAVIATGCASCPKLQCERPGCLTSFCYHCKQYWHPNQTCDAARAERSPNLRSSSISYSNGSNSQSGIKPCPRCGAYIVKMDDGSCNHMTCAVCGAEFCWLCMKEISDLHYLSPSGCTFWGKKPWSRKKKILWQLGMLAGAPVGISLVAGIAIPAMIIGIPVWVGRKLHAKYENASKHKRNLAVTGGVASSILFSPIVAGLAVGIGVPILLAYVYGVVPISLCRSGGCGVTTSTTGVRFEFDDDNEVTVGVSSPYNSGDNQSLGTAGHHVANPSIGTSIGDASLAHSLSASGSQMDRAGLIRDESDRDSASNRAIAGLSLTGSLSGSAVAGPSGFNNRLEVHADVSNAPAIVGSDKFSLKSATVSFDDEIRGDDASTRALAGSITSRDKDNVSITTTPSIDLADNPRSRHNSNSSHSKNLSNHGSPTSNRSVNFFDDGLRKMGSKKKYKRQCISMGDKIHEHTSEKSHDGLSVKSLEANAVLNSDSDHKKSAVVDRNDKSPSSDGSGSASFKNDNVTILKALNGSLSSSYDSVTSHGAHNISAMPPVENDNPGKLEGQQVATRNGVAVFELTASAQRKRRKSCEIAMEKLVHVP